MHFVCYTILCGFQISFLWFHFLMTLVYLCYLKASKLEFSKKKCDLEANSLTNLRFYEICGFTKLPLELFSLLQAHFARQQTKQKDKASKLDKFICQTNWFHVKNLLLNKWMKRCPSPNPSLPAQSPSCYRSQVQTHYFWPKI